MRILVGVLLAIVRVSGQDDTIHGFIGGSVLLPCNCTNINLTRGFQWQMETPNTKEIYRYSKAPEGEVDRITTYVNDDKNNCSILLANITANDQGKYRCSFLTQDEEYESSFPSLTISAKFNVCQKGFKCDVEGLYGDAQILWILDGQSLTNSPTVRIINSSTRGDQLHRFTSELISNVTINSNLTCSVSAGSMSADITAFCKPDPNPVAEEIFEPTEQKNNRIYFLTIPFFLVLIILAAIGFKLSRRIVDNAGYRRESQERHVGHGPDSNLAACVHGTSQEKEILPTQDLLLESV